MRMRRKVVVGHWQNADVHERINVWSRAAAGWYDWQGAKFVRFGDNMRYVAVTDGDKVEAELKFGFSVNTYGIGDLVQVINAVKDEDIDALCAAYEKLYKVQDSLKKGGAKHASLRDTAKIEIGMRKFLEDGNYKGFTDTFEDLHGMTQQAAHRTLFTWLKSAHKTPLSCRSGSVSWTVPTTASARCSSSCARSSTSSRATARLSRVVSPSALARPAPSSADRSSSRFARSLSAVGRSRQRRSQWSSATRTS
jgi:hypothetical protein